MAVSGRILKICPWTGRLEIISVGRSNGVTGRLRAARRAPNCPLLVSAHQHFAPFLLEYPSPCPSSQIPRPSSAVRPGVSCSLDSRENRP